MDKRLIYFTILTFCCMVNGLTFTTAGNGHEREQDVLHSLQNDINNLKTEYAATSLHLSSILSMVVDLQHDLRAIQEELRKEKESYSNLEREVIRLKNLTSCSELGNNRTIHQNSVLHSVQETFNLSLKQQKDEITNEISRMKTDFSTKTTATSTTISGIINSITDIQRKVFFTAGTVSDIDKIWSTNEKIIFPRVISNVGGGYDASTGIFTAPHSGVYVIMCFLATFRNEAVAHLALNGSPLVGIPAATSGGSTERYGAAGNSVILQLAQGDRVWVAHTSGNVLWTRYNAPFPTFSGFRLG